ncbi:type II toxin-antitoxin system VapC family toxin [Nocardia amikacinitolerans]|uniref:type II toxin-antitoxin system VapC family toxin n=1 Tax=Nocardia amikacinitolerans TaxID=756689 RepID=UPI0011812A2D|nr:type II toxin-antitoxin system VapC family toxin [Nocardia amikacinitolerans]MCP2280193.1 hypothetical protein [Nocardia amikacinitolerans]MCP2299464.1 hypothetical protein [Nocardia amikacinitolerans]
MLRRRYGLDAETVTEIMLGLLASAEIVVERADTVRQALRRCAEDPAAAAITGMRLAV